MNVSTAATFVESFADARVRRMYPSADVKLYRSPVDCTARITVTVDERELVHYDREATLRMLSRRLEPLPPRGRHWSLFRRRSQ